jgi:dolichol kinase
MIGKLALFLVCLGAIVGVSWGDYQAFVNLVHAANKSLWGDVFAWIVGVVVLSIIDIYVFFFGIFGMIIALLGD